VCVGVVVVGGSRTERERARIGWWEAGRYLGQMGIPIWSLVPWKEGVRQMTSPVITRLSNARMAPRQQRTSAPGTPRAMQRLAQ